MVKITGNALSKHTDTRNLVDDWPEIEREIRLQEANHSFDKLVDNISS